MNLKDLLEQNRGPILQRWFDLTIETYPLDAQNFFREQKDPFANPLGVRIQEGIKGIYEELLQDEDLNKARPFLEQIVKIQAIQDFPPSQAVAFIPLLKEVIRNQLKRDIQEKQLLGQLSSFEGRIDQLVLLAFDLYMDCRERVYQIKVKELKNGSSMILERMNSFYERKGQKPGLEGDNSNPKKRGRKP